MGFRPKRRAQAGFPNIPACASHMHVPQHGARRMKYEANSTIFKLFCAAAALITVLYAKSEAGAEPHIIEINRHSLRIALPDGWSELPSPHREVTVLLRYGAGPFPTFNIVTVPGSYNTSAQSLEAQTKAILDSYRGVGILDASVAKTEFIELNGRSCVSAQLQYTHSARALEAFVTICTALNRHYVLTYIDERTTIEQRLHLRDRILGAVNFLDGAVTSAVADDRSTDGRNVVTFIALIGLLLTAIFFAVKGYRRLQLRGRKG